MESSANVIVMLAIMLSAPLSALGARNGCDADLSIIGSKCGEGKLFEDWTCKPDWSPKAPNCRTCDAPGDDPDSTTFDCKPQFTLPYGPEGPPDLGPGSFLAERKPQCCFIGGVFMTEEAHEFFTSSSISPKGFGSSVNGYAYGVKVQIPSGQEMCVVSRAVLSDPVLYKTATVGLHAQLAFMGMPPHKMWLAFGGNHVACDWEGNAAQCKATLPYTQKIDEIGAMPEYSSKVQECNKDSPLEWQAITDATYALARNPDTACALGVLRIRDNLDEDDQMCDGTTKYEVAMTPPEGGQVNLTAARAANFKTATDFLDDLHVVADKVKQICYPQKAQEGGETKKWKKAFALCERCVKQQATKVPVVNCKTLAPTLSDVEMKAKKKACRKANKQATKVCKTLARKQTTTLSDVEMKAKKKACRKERNQATKVCKTLERTLSKVEMKAKKKSCRKANKQRARIFGETMKACTAALEKEGITAGFCYNKYPTPNPTNHPCFFNSSIDCPTRSCGPCDQTLKLKLDNAPADTTWMLAISPDAPDMCTTASVTGGPYAEGFSIDELIVSTDICADQEYTFEISNGASSYSLHLDDEFLKEGAEYISSSTFTFLTQEECGRHLTSEDCTGSGDNGCSWEGLRSNSSDDFANP